MNISTRARLVTGAATGVALLFLAVAATLPTMPEPPTPEVGRTPNVVAARIIPDELIEQRRREEAELAARRAAARTAAPLARAVRVRVLGGDSLLPDLVVTVKRRTLAGDPVSVRDRRTDADGVLLLEEVGEYVLTVFPSTGWHGTLEATVSAEANDDLTLPVAQAGTIRGRVVDARGRPADRHVWVMVHGDDRVQKTGVDDDGRFELDGYGTGPYTVRVGHDFWFLESFDTPLEGRSEIEVVIPDERRRELSAISARVFICYGWSSSDDDADLDQLIRERQLTPAPAGVRFNRGETDALGVLRYEAARGWPAPFWIDDDRYVIARFDDRDLIDGTTPWIVLLDRERSGRTSRDPGEWRRVARRHRNRASR